ncbi:putative nuclease HARBI1 [Operophtera brumata]|uniref:Putative nuclease HARBI1 n=1 Tax=Operophtera brumata TaxID=104452 RepID=A0A0L7LSA5_OPEBR|nr:putative nuclease HARBI1 [Operophtera brumata]
MLMLLMVEQHKMPIFGGSDPGYPLREHMMTPIDNAVEDSPERRFNFVQKRARSTIERTFGILKGRWKCLMAARELHYCPETVDKMN